ncbi:hypothetical protein AT15_00955 [Kosmotoga arenicorallina S304]|uniref:Uncharacterized protein n=1 Tax=Kosmotoga arenicorallina S304 TaxID=1453497 RepID=A0A176K0X4_9BACT|nr:hypothetical protein [Kosmotoga arenicorallina]OAA30115.1 hypothetical protein AT15_00955 [Kosmotoga arenicorallina S304]
MKRITTITTLLLLVLSLTLFGETYLSLIDESWKTEVTFPLSKKLNWGIAMGNTAPRIGILYTENWADYSTGFFKVKTRDGSFSLGLYFGEGISVSTTLIQGSYSPPIYSQSFNKIQLASDGKFHRFSYGNYRVPLGKWSLGANMLSIKDESTKVNYLKAYVFVKDFNRSFRLSLNGGILNLGVDLATIGSLGELGYGGGVCYDFSKRAPGLSAHWVFPVSLESGNFTGEIKMFVKTDGVNTKLSFRTPGGKNLLIFGLGFENFTLDEFFLGLMVN